MKAVIAIDSFKGSMTSLEAGNAAKRGILRVIPEAEVVVKPLADGGEGTMDALIKGLGGKTIIISVTDPMGKKSQSQYGILQDGNTAVIEIAQAAGITKVQETKRNPLKATTAGVGEMIKDAVQRGCRKFLIGVGGSATNDGGIGMLKALGFEFLGADGQGVGEGAEVLSKITKIKAERVLTELKECDFQIACDVTNPLCGKYGATYIYGPQKGLPRERLEAIDRGMAQYAEVAERYIGADWNIGEKTAVQTLNENEMRDMEEYILRKDIPGAGAAGGLGFAFITFLHGRLVPGVDLIMDAIDIDKDLENAQYVVTGEGRLDGQTAMGKAPAGVAKRAKQYGCKVLAFAGEVTEDADKCNEVGIDAFFPIVRGVTTFEEAMKRENAERNMELSVEQAFRLLNLHRR